MQLTLLGTGNAAGMPLYGCGCDYCVKANVLTTLKRTHCSAVLKFDDKCYLIDAGQHNLQSRFPAGSLDGVFVTHFHPDHVQGLFDLRWGTDLTLPIYTPPDSEGCSDLYKHPGILQFQAQKKFNTFQLDQLTVTPVPLIHSKPTFGYVFEYKNIRLAYLTDTKGLPPATADYLAKHPLDVMLIDCSFAPKVEGKGHNNLDEVIDLYTQIEPKQTVLTHIGHDFDIWLQENAGTLPESFIVGHDNMTLSLKLSV